MKTAQKTKCLNIRLSPEEHRRLEVIARHHERTASQVIRDLLLREARRVERQETVGGPDRVLAKTG